MDSIALISRPTLRRTRRRCTDGNASSSGTRRKENYISQKETGKRGRRNGANDEAVEEGRRGLGRWLGLARPVSGLVKRARCSLVAGEGIVRRRIGALRLEGEKVAVCVCKERRSEAGREERNKETARERRKRQGLLGVCARNSAAVSITLHPVTRFPTELFPPIRHARRAERTSGLLARSRDDTIAARRWRAVHASIHPFPASSRAECATSTPKNARHVEIRTLSRSWLFCRRRIARVYIYISMPISSSSLRAFAMIDWQRADKTGRVPIRPRHSLSLSRSLFYPSLRRSSREIFESPLFVRFFFPSSLPFFLSFSFCLFPRRKNFYRMHKTREERKGWKSHSTLVAPFTAEGKYFQ